MTMRLKVYSGILAFAGLLAGCKDHTVVLPPPSVQVTPVVQQDVPIYHEWIATLDGSINAQIRSQVSGYLLSQSYREGTLVHKDDLLFQIDPRVIQATLDQAKGQLAQAQAQLGRTDMDVKRYTPLAKEGAVSQQDLDNATQANLAAKADVAAAEASVAKAQLDLSFTQIRCPITGICGLANAQIGDLISPSSGPLTTVSCVDPIKALFTISEQDYLNYITKLPTTQSRSAFREQLEFELILSNAATYPLKGTLFAVQREVDQQTGTLQIAATFPNPNNLLRPGQFVRVRARIALRRDAMLVPQRAVTELQSIYQVAVLDNDDKVEIRTVEVGERYGDQWIITAGLSPGDRVVAEGVQKVRDGLKVNAVPYTPAPSATQPDRTPPDSTQPSSTLNGKDGS